MIHEAKGKYKGYQYSTYTVKRVDAHIEHGTQLCLCVLSENRGFEGEELKQRMNYGTAQKPSEREMRIIFELLTMQSYKVQMSKIALLSDPFYKTLFMKF